MLLNTNNSIRMVSRRNTKKPSERGLIKKKRQMRDVVGVVSFVEDYLFGFGKAGVSEQNF